MRCERKADVVRANASNKTVTYPNTRVITNRRGHVGFTYTRVDKFHQTLGECSAGQFQTPLLLPIRKHYKREARLPLESGNETMYRLVGAL